MGFLQVNRSLLLSAVWLFITGGCEGLGEPPFVICDFGSTHWAGDVAGGKGPMAFTPEDLDGQLCDHFLFLIKGFEFVGETTDVADEHRRIRDEFLAKGVSLREGPYGRQVMAHIDIDHPQVELPDSDMGIQTLAKSTVQFLKSRQLDGLCLSCNDLAGGRLGKYLRLLKALRMEFSRHGLILSPSLPPKSHDLYSDTELMELLGLANYILVDPGFSWDARWNVTGLHAPISALDSTVQWYEGRGIPKEMMVPKVALVAVIARLKDIAYSGLGAETEDPGFEVTDSLFGNGVIPAYEMMMRLSDPEESWLVRRDNSSSLPFAVNTEGVWASFEDESSLRAKADYIRRGRMAGGLIMPLEMDDYGGFMGKGRSPLAHAFAEGLRNGS